MSPIKPVAARSNFTLWLVLAVCLAPFVGSLALYHFAPPTKRMNYGELIDVVPLMDEVGMQGELQLLDGKRITLGSLRGKWLMLQRASGECPGLCGENLWKLRQVRLTQGDNQERIQRVWLVEGDTLPPEALLREHEGLLVVMATRSEAGRRLLRQMTGSGDDPASLWLADPLGNLMLRWPPLADPSAMKKDLSRLLRTSRVG
jgi:hypothetical protein